MLIGFDGVLCGVFGGYCDIVIVFVFFIIVVLLVCGCILILVDNVLICIISGFSVDILVIDYGIVVNLVCSELVECL